MSVAVRTSTEITDQAMTRLIRGMGLADTMRFPRQVNTGMRNYPEERDALIGDLTLEGISARARRLRGSKL